jgi:glycosyltransferase involved in cell wall biosynthesis
MYAERHVILPRGIPEPPSLATKEVRDRLRRALRITSDQIVILYVGRLVREKGVFELIEAISVASGLDSRIICVMVGSEPAFDETINLHKLLMKNPNLQRCVQILPSCYPDKVWEYLSAADIFAFPSHEEGMPNSLLEAMVMRVPAIAFAIPPVLEIDDGTGSIALVPPLDSSLFAQSILRLATISTQRLQMAESGRAQIIDRFMVRKNMAEAFRRLTNLVEKRSRLGSAPEGFVVDCLQNK